MKPYIVKLLEMAHASHERAKDFRRQADISAEQLQRKLKYGNDESGQPHLPFAGRALPPEEDDVDPDPQPEKPPKPAPGAPAKLAKNGKAKSNGEVWREKGIHPGEQEAIARDKAEGWLPEGA